MNYNELSNGTMISIRHLANIIKNENTNYTTLDSEQLFENIKTRTQICFDSETLEMKQQCIDYLKESLNKVSLRLVK